MAFAVYTEQTDGFHAVILEDASSFTRVTILPETGAMLHSFEVQTATGPMNIIDNYQGPSILFNELNTSFKGCKLSPFACRIPDGTYEHEHKVYKFQNISKDGSAIHGLVYDKLFKLVDQFCDDTQASILLKYNYKKEDEGYPFESRCEVRYTLTTGNVLQVQTTIINLSGEVIPIVDGWHPYFRLGGKVDDWTLVINSSTMLEFDDRLVPTGDLLPNTRFLEGASLSGVELDNSFVLDKDTPRTACILYNPLNKLSVSFFPDATYPYLQIYIPPGRESIAIENLSGAPNAFNNKMGLMLLQPGTSKTFTVHYKTNIE